MQTVNRKADTQMKIGRIGIVLPGDVLVDSVFIPDKQRDTIIFAGQLRIRADLLALLHHRISVRLISLQHSTVKLEKMEDGNFNFSYIINALNKNNAAATDTAAISQKKQSGNSMQFKIHDLSLKNIYFSYKDMVDSLEMHYRIGELELTVDHFDPEKSIYKLNKLDIVKKILKLYQR